MKIGDKISNREQWFIDRIGKVVYRNKMTWDYGIFRSVYVNGLIITDECHANCLYCCESEFTAEGQTLKYFDTINERDEFEKCLK